MRKRDVPLREFGDVEAVARYWIVPHPCVFSVTTVEVVGEKVDAVHTLRGEVVQRADDVFAPTVAPGWITSPPVTSVGLVMVNEGPSVVGDASMVGRVIGVVKIVVAEEVFWRVGTALEKVVAVLELEIVPIGVAQVSLALETFRVRWCGADFERAGLAVECG